MFNLKINKDDIKNFFVKKYKTGSVMNKRILGITMQYVRGKQYKDFIGILNYIRPLIEEKVSVDDLINDYRKKLNHKKIPADVFLNDESTMTKIVEDIKPELLPRSKGELREIQLSTLEFAKEIMSDIEKNTDINVWLDGGSLLGAVRHKGFIPWDDDMDFGTMRGDYEKLIEYLSNKYTSIDTNNWKKDDYSLKIKDIVASHINEIIAVRTYDTFKIIKGTPEKFIILDFFAWDYYNDFHNVVTLQKYTNIFKEKIDQLKTYKEIYQFYKEEFEKKTDVVEKSNTIAPGIDNHGFCIYSRKGIIRNSDIFPLKKIPFEDWEFYVPNDCHNYLKSHYNFYNKIPLKGLNIAAHVNVKNIEI